MTSIIRSEKDVEAISTVGLSTEDSSCSSIPLATNSVMLGSRENHCYEKEIRPLDFSSPGDSFQCLAEITAIICALFYRYSGQECIPLHLILASQNTARQSKIICHEIEPKNDLSTFVRRIHASLISESSSEQMAVQNVKRADGAKSPSIAIIFQDGGEEQNHLLNNEKLVIRYCRESAKDRIKVKFCGATFTRVTIEAFVQHFVNLAISAFKKALNASVIKLSILDSDEEQSIYALAQGLQINHAFCPPHKQIESFAKATPKKTAISFLDKTLNYAELNAKANQLVVFWFEQGFKPGFRCSVLLPPSEHFSVVLLAILKSGATYIPIDPEFPQERIDIILEDANPDLVICDEANSSLIRKPVVSLELQEIFAQLGQYSDSNPNVSIAEDDTAYIYYTSGTTGIPKGVMGSYKNLNHYVRVARDQYGMDANVTMPAVAKFTFSISMFELLGPLYCGGTSVILPRAQVLDLDFMVNLVKKINMFHIGPSLLKRIVSKIKTDCLVADFKHIKHASSGGDLIPVELLHDMTRVFPAAEHYVIYGCSEIACMGCTFLVDPTNLPSKTYVGKPFADMEVRVFDEHQNLLPPEYKGEIYFSGNGVTKGYLNRDELTAEKFISIEGKKFYRTGDVGRLMSDGNIEMLGRQDFQIQINGIRVELGEIDYYLRKLTGVKDAIASGQKLGNDDAFRIIAYVVAQEGQVLNVADMRAQLARILPDYMLPSGFVELDELPLNTNLKVDRKSLPIAKASNLMRVDSDIRFSEKLNEIVALLNEELEQSISLDDAGLDFISLGFDSIQFMQIVKTVKCHYGISVNFLDISDHLSSAERLAEYIEDQSIRSDLIEGYGKPSELKLGFDPDGIAGWYSSVDDEFYHYGVAKKHVNFNPFDDANKQDLIPLSSEQLEIWLACQKNTEASSAFNLSFELKFQKSVDETVLMAALQRLQHQNQILRVCIDESAQAFQILENSDVSIELIDSAKAELDFCDRVFTLNSSPLFRLACDARDTSRIIFTFHHIILDGWSIDLFVNSLLQAYSNLLDGKPDRLSFDKYQDAIKAEILDDEPKRVSSLSYWLEKHKEMGAPLDLPSVYPRGANRTYKAGYFKRKLDDNTEAKIDAFAANMGVTSFSLYYSVFILLLNRLTSEKDITVGVPLAGQLLSGRDQVLSHNVKTLPVRCFLETRSLVSHFISDTFNLLQESSRHGHVSYGELLPHLTYDRNNERPPLVSVVFTQDPTHTRINYENISAQFNALPRRYETFDLWVNVIEESNQVFLEAQFNAALFNEEFLDSWFCLYDEILADIIKNDAKPICELPSLPKNDRARIDQWNDTKTDFNSPLDLKSLFMRQVKASPEFTAIEFGDESLSYREFDEKSSQLANLLYDLELRQGDDVGVYCVRSIEMLLAIYAIVKSGCVYVPLDPDFPADRIKYVVENSQAKTVLSFGYLAEEFKNNNTAIEVVDLHQCEDQLAEKSVKPPAVEINPKDDAYIIYTSGSTGRPKGVVNSHQGIANRLLWKQQVFQASQSDRILFKTPFSFDVSVWEIFWPLQVGATMVIAPPEVHKDPDALEMLVRDKAVTITHFVPSMLNAYVNRPEVKPHSLRAVLCSGEALPADLQTDFYRVMPKVELHNLYGPTEAAVDVTHWYCPPDALPQVVPIGAPIANTQIHIVDAIDQPVPIGVAGELLIAGVQVAKGYKNNPDITAKSFIETDLYGEMQSLYRTGDLARWNQQGQIEYLGRLDFQVKIRGLRIEIGEIETLLNQYEGVDQSVVIVQTSERGDQNLVGFYVSNSDISPSDFKTYLGKQLPPYMVPQLYQRMSSIPLTTSGKADRKTLMKSGVFEIGSRERTAPKTETEIMIATFWSNLLEINDIAREDEFFAIGGHSLLAIKFISLLKREKAIKLPYNAMSLTLKELAELYDKSFADIDSNEHLDSSDVEVLRITHIDMAPEQKEIFLASSQSLEASCSYNLSSSFIILGELNVDFLKSSLASIIERHQALRTYVDATSIQLNILNSYQAEVEFRSLDSDEFWQDEKIRKIQEEQSLTPFDFSEKQPLTRYLLLKISEEKHILMVTFHHLIADGWTRGLFLDEFLKIYKSKVDDVSLSLDKPLYLTHYINQRLRSKNSKAYTDSINYWVSEYEAPLPDMNLPLAKEQGVVKDFRAKKVQHDIDCELALKIKDVASRSGNTLFNFMLSVYAVVLSRISQTNDICIGVPFAGQPIDGMDVLMGQCARVLPIRIKVEEQNSFSDHLRLVSEVVAKAHEHSQPTFTELFDKIKLNNSKLVSNVFSIDQGEKEFNAGPIHIQCEENPISFAVFDLGLTLCSTRDKLYFEWIYNVSGYEESTVKHWLVIYEKILSSLVENIEIPLSELDISTEYDREILKKLNDTRVDMDFCSASEKILQTSKEKPNHIAATCNDYSFTYKSLDQNANKLAHKLIELGVKPSSRIALAMTRTSLAVIAMLAAHRCGCAYAPIDPGQPEQRLLSILDDLKAKVILTDQDIADSLLSDGRLKLNPKEIIESKEGNEEKPDVALKIQPSDAAYVIYTSGSTGTPKGVAVSHGNMINLLNFMQDAIKYNALDNQLAIANFTFDPHVFEIFLPLVCSAATHIASNDEILDAKKLSAKIEKLEISVMQATPVTWRMLAEYGWRVQQKLKAVISGGEALPRDARKMLLANANMVINAYGPTETTVLSSTEFLKEDSDPSVIGQPIHNTQCFVVDKQNRPLPIGGEGELVIGGAGVSLGYLNLPDMTALKFIERVGREKGKFYKTGDNARILPTGKIQFRGRVDEQIKIRGLRIEPLEIEIALEKLEAVDQACVVVNRSKNTPLLVAYYKATSALETQALREHLVQYVPAYMLPQRFECLDEIPQTSSGKINRKILQSIKLQESTEQLLIGKPKTDTELLLTQCWQEVLKLEVINRTDDFFSIGGHSLAAVKVLSQINAILGINLPINVFLQTPVLKDLAAYIDRNPVNSDQRNTVVLKDGNKTPLFCLYGVLLYKDLAESLPDDQKVIGVYLNEEMELLRQDNIDAFMSAFADMSVIAKKYADTIRKAQPKGPYYLAGESFGGVVAFEVAQLLKREGEEVKLVALMDSWLPGKHQKLLLATRFLKHFELFLKKPVPYFKDICAKLEKIVKKKTPSFESSKAVKKTESSIVDLRQKARDKIVENYDPQYYVGDVVLFRASERSPFEPKDRNMGWTKFVRDINVYSIEGDHLSILTRPNVEAMARHLAAYLPNSKK